MRNLILLFTVFILASCTKDDGITDKCGVVSKVEWSHKYGDVHSTSNPSGELLPEEPYVIIYFESEPGQSLHPYTNGDYAYDIDAFNVGDYWCIQSKR